MGKKPTLLCPYCHSSSIVHNGRPHQDKKQFFCKSCRRYFSEDTLKGYPPSNIPFPVIAYLLYLHKKVPDFSNTRKFRRFVNYWLSYLKVHDKEISRQTLHHWIKSYDSYLDKVITFTEARNFCKKRLEKVLPTPPLKPIPYGRALKILESKYGKAYLVSLIQTDEEFFKELVELVGKHQVFSWEFLEANFERRSGSQHPLPVG